MAEQDPHGGQPVLERGRALAEARGAVVLVHGRGATAESLLPLADALGPDDLAYLAPQAAGSQWYPNRFMEPIGSNEPWLSSALDLIGGVLDRIHTAGLRRERTMLVGFSQGACLAAEFVVRYARRYGGLAALSGGLIGPPGTVWDYPGSLDGTPAFLGCGDRDPHIPVERVEESAEVLRRMGAEVRAVVYEGLEHTVNDDELRAVRAMAEQLSVRDDG